MKHLAGVIRSQPTWRAAPAMVEGYLRSIGKAVADVADAVDTSQAGFWAVNTRHAAWLALTPSPEGPPPLVDAPPIDLVYLWVDGSDAMWRAKYRKFVGKNYSEGRFTDAGELRASLRSADLYAPWVRRVFVVTDRQRPAWLVNHPRVTVVDHRQIIPAEHLPTFNSHAIEPWLHRIEGLSEHFLYANDDTFFGNHVTPGQFFAGDGRALMPLEGRARGGEGIHGKACENAADILSRMFGEKPRRRGWHQIKPYRRSMLAELESVLADDIARVCANKRRTATDIAWNTVLWPGYAIEKGYAVDSPRGAITQGYIGVGKENEAQRMAEAIQRRPHTLCINNGRGESAGRVGRFLAEYFGTGIDDATAALRRVTCQNCEHGNDIQGRTGHCRKIGNRSSCPSCRVSFQTSPVTRCPLALWPA